MELNHVGGFSTVPEAVETGEGEGWVIACYATLLTHFIPTEYSCT